MGHKYSVYNKEPHGQVLWVVFGSRERSSADSQLENRGLWPITTRNGILPITSELKRRPWAPDQPRETLMENWVMPCPDLKSQVTSLLVDTHRSLEHIHICPLAGGRTVGSQHNHLSLFVLQNFITFSSWCSSNTCQTLCLWSPDFKGKWHVKLSEWFSRSPLISFALIVTHKEHWYGIQL